MNLKFRPLIIILLTVGTVSSISAYTNSTNFEQPSNLSINHSTIQSYDDHTTSYTGHVVPISFVADYYLFQQKGIDTYSYIIDVLDIVNEIFVNNSMPFVFEIDQVMIFTDQNENDAILEYISTGGSEIDPLELLNSLTNFVSSNSSFSNSMEVQLLSGSDFDGSTVGLGWVGSTDTFSNTPHSIVQASSNNLLFDSVVSIHEIGHNYAMTHDGSTSDTGAGPNNCDSNGYIMSTSLSISNPNLEFSPCSKDEFNALMVSGEFDLFIDNTNPVLADLEDINLVQIPGSSYNLAWSITDDNLNYYNIFIDSQLYETSTQVLDNKISYDVNLTDLGTYNITIEVFDLVQHHVIDMLNVTISENKIPTISNPDIAEDIEGTSVSVSWMIENDGDLALIEVFKNQIKVDSVSFSTNISYTYEMNNYPPGNYNITILVTDQIGNSVTSSFNYEFVKTPIESTTSKSEEDGNFVNSVIRNLPYNILWAIFSMVLLITIQRKHH